MSGALECKLRVSVGYEPSIYGSSNWNLQKPQRWESLIRLTAITIHAQETAKWSRFQSLFARQTQLLCDQDVGSGKFAHCLPVGKHMANKVMLEIAWWAWTVDPAKPRSSDSLRPPLRVKTCWPKASTGDQDPICFPFDGLRASSFLLKEPTITSKDCRSQSNLLSVLRLLVLCIILPLIEKSSPIALRKQRNQLAHITVKSQKDFISFRCGLIWGPVHLSALLTPMLTLSSGAIRKQNGCPLLQDSRWEGRWELLSTADWVICILEPNTMFRAMYYPGQEEVL